jgi:alkanesulfonate monooxygenase SsuD/methylene tetrahydromethanopterin reductase-like flavin-dependent oxidoreductase (luciferase family)
MQKNQTEAMEIFRLVAKRYPDDWIARLSNARLRSSEQNFTAARSEMKVALAGAPDQLKPQLENLLKRLEANEDINQ